MHDPVYKAKTYGSMRIVTTAGGTSPEFTRFWNETGQFVSPVGDLRAPEAIAFSKEIAKAVHEALVDELGDVRAEAARIQDAAEAEGDKASQLVDNIRGALSLEEPDAVKLTTIQAFIEAY